MKVLWKNFDKPGAYTGAYARDLLTRINRNLEKCGKNPVKRLEKCGKNPVKRLEKCCKHSVKKLEKYGK